MNANIALKEIARGEGVEFLDIYHLFVDAKGRPAPDLLAEDGVHLSDKGYAVWSDALSVVIERIK